MAEARAHCGVQLQVLAALPPSLKADSLTGSLSLNVS